MENLHANFWRAFTQTGDPLAYLDYTRNRAVRNDTDFSNFSLGRNNENNQSKRFSS